MAENEKETKDNFDYESINEDSIEEGKKIEKKTFTLDEIETLRYHKFLENHHNCQVDKNGKSKFGAIGGGISVELTPTGIGNSITCKCEGCHKYANITNYDSW